MVFFEQVWGTIGCIRLEHSSWNKFWSMTLLLKLSKVSIIL